MRTVIEMSDNIKVTYHVREKNKWWEFWKDEPTEIRLATLQEVINIESKYINSSGKLYEIRKTIEVPHGKWGEEPITFKPYTYIQGVNNG